MTQVAWLRIRSVVESVMDLPASERTPYLDRACPDPELRRWVDSMLASFAQSEYNFLAVPAVALGGPGCTDEPSWTGRRIGPYQILEEIAEGGMGAVYRAVRVDQHYEKQVAIKVIRGGSDSASMLARFRAERQILANLDHPNIARLLDGGSEDGAPYFVMELVDGIPIDRYCRENHLSTAKILILFRTVCAAVQHAHHNLIVHRDLKPANILVSPDGVPTLLDFGIAKILDPGNFPGTPEPTAPMLRMLTLEFASPEQVRGEAITTATDVYSLGVALYVLLTGQLPYPRKRLAHEMATAICQTEPLKPSGAGGRFQRALKGDLDSVVLKALRKDPRRRYASVEQFSDDLRRCVEGLPVRARPDTPSYRVSKFVRRNRKGVIAAATVLLALIAGFAVAVRESLVAEAQRARAEKRFEEIRRVAGSLVFEMQDAIANLPGGRPTRELLLRRATEMLDGLAKDAGADAALDIELAAAYVRLGEVQGNPIGDNRGDVKAGVGSLRKAVRLNQAAVSADPRNLTAQAELGHSYQNLSSLLDAAGDAAGAGIAIERAIRIQESLLRKAPANQDFRGALGVDYQRRGALKSTRADFAGAMEDQRMSLALLQNVVDARPQSMVDVAQLAFAHKRVGALLVQRGQTEEGLKHYLAALSLEDRISAAHPEDGRNEFNKTYAYNDIGSLFFTRGEFTKSLEYHRKALSIREAYFDRDPNSVLARQRLLASLSNVAAVYDRLGDWNGVLSARMRTVEVHAKLSALNPANVIERLNLGEAHLGAAAAYTALARHLPASRSDSSWNSARIHFRQAQAVFESLRSQNGAPAETADRLSSAIRGVAECDSHRVSIR